MIKKYEIIIVPEKLGFTAMYVGRVQKDKRHTCVGFFAKTEETAKKKLIKWLKNNNIWEY